MTDIGQQIVKAGETAGLSERQAALVDAIQSGLSDDDAFKAAGYQNRPAGMAALRSNAVQAALKEARLGCITGALTEKALAALELLVTGPATPAATRLGAVKLVLELGGLTGHQDDDGSVPLHEMSEAQLRRFMAKAQAVVDDGGSGPIIAIAPDNGA